MSTEILYIGGPRHGEKTSSAYGMATEITLDGGSYHLKTVGPCRIPIRYEWGPSR
jgi:hypothetical protein